MTESFADYLSRNDVDTDTLHQAARLYLAERADDLPAEEMYRAVVASSADREAVDAALDRLKSDSAMAEQASLALLSAAWEEPGEAERIRPAIEHAKASLPVVEVTIVAVALMYGVYLAVTRG